MVSTRSTSRTLRTGLSLCCFALLLGCKSRDNVGSENVNPDVIYQIYEVRYDAQTDTNWYFARFRVGGGSGTNLVLNPPSSVSANGQAMTQGEGTFLTALGGVLPGAYYHARKPGFVPSHEFEYRTANGAVLKNAISINPIAFPNEMPNTISRSKSFSVRFNGPPLRGSEKVTLDLTTTAPPGDTRKNPVYVLHATTRTINETEVTLPADQLSLLLDGPGTLRLSRTLEQTPTATAAKAGGEISSIYQTKTVPVTLVP
jgi:hypothetical protein